jgi:hypothetical protein
MRISEGEDLRIPSEFDELHQQINTIHRLFLLAFIE